MKLDRLAVDRGFQPERPVKLEYLAGALVPCGREQAPGGVEMETPLVQVRPRAQLEELQFIRVVRDEDDARREGLPIHAEPERPRVSRHAKQRAESRQRLAAATVRLAAMDEGGVGAEGHVVQKQAFVRPADVDSPLVAAERL